MEMKIEYFIILGFVLLLFVALLFLARKRASFLKVKNREKAENKKWHLNYDLIKNLIHENIWEDQILLDSLLEQIVNKKLVTNEDFIERLKFLVNNLNIEVWNEDVFFDEVKKLIDGNNYIADQEKELKYNHFRNEIWGDEGQNQKNKMMKSINSLRKEVSKINYTHPSLDLAIKLLNIIYDGQKSPLLVTVLGEFSSGKSTFINALLKENLLAMKIVPTTATITKLQYGPRKNMVVHKKDGSIETYDVKELKKFTVETHIKDDKVLNDIFYVQLEINNEFLADIDLADTPGFNSTIERHTEITNDFIRYSDVVIWLFNAEQMLKKSEVETLEKYCNYFKPIVIINQIDKLGLGNKTEILKELDTPIKRLDGKVLKIFPVSSKLALNSLNGEFEKSGMQDVLNFFKSDLIPDAKTTKSKMALVKLLEVVKNIQIVRLDITSKIRIIEKIIVEYEDKKTNWENLKTKWIEILYRWEGDRKDPNITTDWMIMNLSRYFSILEPSKTIQDKSKDLLRDLNILQNENTKIEREYEKITILENEIDSLFLEYDEKFEVYNNKFFKSMFDSFFGDFTQEKQRINYLASQCNNKSNSLNNSIKKYNSHINYVNEKWDALNDKLYHFLNTEILKEINVQGTYIQNLGIELEEKESEIKEFESNYKIYSNQLNLIDNNIVSSLQNLYSSIENDFESRNGEFNDFESMLNEFLSYSEKHSEINWKQLYSRDQLTTVVGTHKEKYNTIYIDVETKDYEKRIAKEV